MKKTIGILGLIGLLFLMTACHREEEMVVAIVDTGIDERHPDLKDYIWKNHTKLPGTFGYDFMNEDDDPHDDGGHGTHVAGIVVQEAKKAGVDKNLKLMAIKYMDQEGHANLDRAIECYRYIIDAKKQGVNIVAVNNSWGVDENSKELEELIEEAGELGILSFQAAGNTATDLDLVKTYPAGYKSPYTVVVAASNGRGELADFSCYGKSTVNIAAPGTGIIAPFYKESYLPEDNLLKDDFWNLQPSNDTYEENSEKKYQNLKEWTLPKSSEFWGMDFRFHGKGEKWLMVEAKVDNLWMNIGTFPLREENFVDTRIAQIPSGSKNIRLIVPEAKRGDQIEIQQMGAGKSTGKYACLSGTSMATPYVIGGYLKIVKDHPKGNVREWKDILLSQVRPLKSTKPIEGNGEFSPGIEPAAVIDKYQDGVLYGKFFGKTPGQIILNGKKAEIMAWTPEEITLKTEELPLGASDITIEKKGSFPRNYRLNLRPRWEGYQEESPLPKEVQGGVAFSQGDQVILLGGLVEEMPNREIYSYSPKEKKWEIVGRLSEREGDILQIGASVTSFQGKNYIAAFDEINQQTILYSYDLQTGLEKEKIAMPSGKSRGILITWNDAMYLVGGIEKTENTGSSNIWKFDPKNRAFHVVASLKDERFSPWVVAEPEGLYIIGGLHGDNEPVTDQEFFDGKKSRVLKDTPIYEGSTWDGEIIDCNYLVSDGVGHFNGRFQKGILQGENHPMGEEICRGFMATSLEKRGYIMGGTKDLRATNRVYSFPLH